MAALFIDEKVFGLDLGGSVRVQAYRPPAWGTESDFRLHAIVGLACQAPGQRVDLQLSPQEAEDLAHELIHHARQARELTRLAHEER